MQSWGRWLIAGVGVITSFILSLVMLAPTFAENTDVTIGVGDTTFTVQGYTSPGVLVTITDGGGTIGTTIADGAGAYSQHFTAQAPGLHNLKIYAQDRSGRTTTPVAIEVNVTEHAETNVNLFLPPTTQFSATSATQGEVITLRGEGTPNTTVIIYLDQANYATTLVDGNGFWQYELPTAALSIGEHQLFVIAQQSNGSQSYPSASQSFIIQPAPGASAPPASSQPRSPSTPVVLEPKPGTVVNQDTLDISGVADPGTRIEVWSNDKIIGSVFADAAGRWKLTIPLVEGNNNIKIRSCKDGLCSDFSGITSVLFAPPSFRELLWFELKKYSYHIGTGEEVTLEGKVQHGQKPYKFVIEWGDEKKEERTESSDTPQFRHRFTQPGKYGGFITVSDAKGDSLRLYFTTTVEAVPTPIWLIGFGFSFLFLLPLLLLFIRRRKRRIST